MSFTTKVDTDPGPTARVYWSHFFSFADKGPRGNQGDAYTGMQVTGAGNERLFLFSVWNATKDEAKAGSPGSYCVPFDGEGKGMSCRMAVDWVAGHTYRSDVKHEGDRWFSVTVTDEDTSESFDLGRIRAGADAILRDGMTDFTEYFEWSNPNSSCFDQPYSSATFSLPLASSGKVPEIAEISTTATPGCPASTTVTPVLNGSRHDDAVGNTVRGQVFDSSGNVMQGSLSGSPVTLRKPRETKHQAWVYAWDSTLRLPESDQCLTMTTPGGAVAMTGCRADSSQQWTYSASTQHYVSNGLCLTTQAGWYSALTVSACDVNDSSQKWTPPSDPLPARG
ncbi:RICIN domain-containing protein [Luethyella okanaganae]|uniref:DUF3472 domain-containing protein n=1 Tax=Luethyella okanaganae TaxID=69372 RepID=A0ABW1VG36_9MICO